jgi:hypothetical protein
VVARPRSFGGYEIIEGGIKTRVNAEVFAEYKSRALCFYRPLPSRSLNVKDLITYMKNCLQKSDYVFVILLTLVVALVGMLLPKIARMLTSVVYESGSMSLLIATAEYILAVLISSALFSMLNSLMLARLTSKTSLSVEAAVMMRVLSLPASFFRGFSSGELQSRTQSVSTLCKTIENTNLDEMKITSEVWGNTRKVVRNLSFLGMGEAEQNSFLMDIVGLAHPKTDAEREGFLHGVSDAFTTRGQTYLLIIRADAYSPKFGENDSVQDGTTLATTHAIVELFRDPVPAHGPDGVLLPSDGEGPVAYHNWYIRSFRVF